MKKWSFGHEMHSQFVEEVRYRNSGIWVRIHSNELNCDKAIIRKSKSIYKDSIGDDDQVIK